MTALLEMKQHLKIFYSKYDVYLIPAIKFLFALLVFMMINGQIGFMDKIANPAVALLLALFCSFLPVNMTAVFGAFFIVAHAFALSLELFAIAAGLLFIMYALYFRVAPGYGYVLVLTPIMFMLKIPHVLPLVLGLVGGPVAAVPVACGTVIYSLMYFMKNNEKMLSSSETEQLTSRILYVVDNVLNNKGVILTILVFAVTLVVVYVIHRMSVDYAWYLAIGVGAVVNIVFFLLGALIMKANVAIGSLVLGTLIAAVIALVVEFLVFSVDYTRTEYTQFEDDEYYYYVKAVPKMSIAVADKKVKKINSRNKSRKKR
ncbi:MAG: hypothetical protein IKV59_06360 [Lachnospiraceae bacterium]|nr:hypothetical protein [Lachnospiraceae bacterium]